MPLLLPVSYAYDPHHQHHQQQQQQQYLLQSVEEPEVDLMIVDSATIDCLLQRKHSKCLAAFISITK